LTFVWSSYIGEEDGTLWDICRHNLQPIQTPNGKSNSKQAYLKFCTKSSSSFAQFPEIQLESESILSNALEISLFTFC
jgi:hypothetical protein